MAWNVNLAGPSFGPMLRFRASGMMVCGLPSDIEISPAINIAIDVRTLPSLHAQIFGSRPAGSLENRTWTSLGEGRYPAFCTSLKWMQTSLPREP
jgi:hypothetical protein